MNNNVIMIIGIVGSIASIIGLVTIFNSSAKNRQNFSGDRNIQIIGQGNSVNYQRREEENDLINVLEVTEKFYNDYLKYLNKSFSKIDDETGFTEPPPRNPDGSIDFTRIESAPAYGVSKLSLAEYLYTRDEISHSFAQQIDELILKAKWDNPELGGLDYDPILMGTDIPSSLKFSKPSVTGNSAKITVYTVWTWNGDSTKSPINVSLKKTGRTWRISDIVNGRR